MFEVDVKNVMEEEEKKEKKEHSSGLGFWFLDIFLKS